jgi:hypothetical protein
MAAMQAQVREQGRDLGGRPPYGYRLADAGPHPNAAHARWGRRLHRLEPDPGTAPHLRWIFAQRLAGHSVASIARALNERAVPCPSGMDPERNRHRSRAGWTLRTVATILANPRYTGRQVWNRQNSKTTNQDPPRWAPATHWVISKRLAHTPLVSQTDFVTAQAIRTNPTAADGTARTFLLAGLLVCRRCGRRMESHWVHGRPGYRCRHGHTSAKPATAARPKTVYLREDDLLASLRAHLSQTNGDNPSIGHDPRDLAAFLHASPTTITCDATAWNLDIQGGRVSTSSRRRTTQQTRPVGD